MRYAFGAIHWVTPSIAATAAHDGIAVFLVVIGVVAIIARKGFAGLMSRNERGLFGTDLSATVGAPASMVLGIVFIAVGILVLVGVIAPHHHQ